MLPKGTHGDFFDLLSISTFTLLAETTNHYAQLLNNGQALPYLSSLERQAYAQPIPRETILFFQKNPLSLTEWLRDPEAMPEEDNPFPNEGLREIFNVWLWQMFNQAQVIRRNHLC